MYHRNQLICISFYYFQLKYVYKNKINPEAYLPYMHLVTSTQSFKKNDAKMGSQKKNYHCFKLKQYRIFYI